jgi:hypothetical protein
MRYIVIYKNIKQEYIPEDPSTWAPYYTYECESKTDPVTILPKKIWVGLAEFRLHAVDKIDKDNK